MRKYLIILFTLITSISFGQQKYTIKIQGQPGIYGLANNATGDSLIFYVQGVRKAIPVTSNVDLSNYYNKTENNNLLNGKLAIADTASMLSPYATALRGKVDYVATISDLQSYSGHADAVIVQDLVRGGTFNYISTGLADNGVIFSATGKGSGYWVRKYDPSVGVSVDWWGDDAVAIQKAMNFAGAGGVINFTPNKTYLSNATIIPLVNQTLNGNRATLKRMADSVVTITTDANTTGTSIIVNAVPSTWQVGKALQIYTDSTMSGSSGVLIIQSISGNTITLTEQIGSNVRVDVGHPQRTFWPQDSSKVRLIFGMVGEYSTPINYRISNLIFDGNRDNVKGNYYWAVNPTIVASGTGASVKFDRCQFYNIPNENIIGHGFEINGCYAKNLNGSFVHTSASSTNIPNRTPAMIIGNVTDSTNQIPHAVSGHSEGAITFSNTPGFVTISDNRFKNGKDGVFGKLGNTASPEPSNGGMRNMIISGNYATNFSSIFYSITAAMPSDVKAGHLFINGNVFDNCGVNNFGSQRLAIDSAYDTLMIGNNLLVGGTTWEIPVQKSDILQRFILNNNSVVPQPAQINISGPIKASTASFTLPSGAGNIVTYNGASLAYRTIAEMKNDLNIFTGIGSTNYLTKWTSSGALGYDTWYITSGNLYNGGTFSVQSGQALSSTGYKAYITNAGMYFTNSQNDLKFYAGNGYQVHMKASTGLSPTLGSGGPFGIVGSNDLYGLYGGVIDASGDSWLQVMRSDAGTSVYNLLLNPLGGNVISGGKFKTFVNPTMTAGDSLSLVNKKYVDGGFEPIITTKNAAFNKPFGTTPGTVKEGNYTPTNLDASIITTGKFDTARIPTTNLYATSGIKMDTISNPGGITFKVDSTVLRLGGNNDLLHNDTAHWIGLNKNDSLILRVGGDYAGIITHNGGITSIGYDGMRQFYSAGYTGTSNNNFGDGGQYMNQTGNENNSFGTNAMRENLSFGNSAFGNNGMRGNLYGGNTSVFGNNSGFPDYTGWETLDGCTFIGANTGPAASIPTTAGVYNSIALGKDARVTKDAQMVLGSTSITETLIRGSVYANIVPRDTLIASADTMRINADIRDAVQITFLATNVFIANPTGTLKNFKPFTWRIKSNSSSHTISFGSMFRFSTDLTAPTSIAADATIQIKGSYNIVSNTIDITEIKTFNPPS